MSRTVDLLRKEGKRISIDHAKPGDIIFFRTSKKRKLTHAGIVVGRKRDVPFHSCLIFKGSYHFFNERKLLEQSLRTNTKIDSLTFPVFQACPQLPTLCFGLLQVY